MSYRLISYDLADIALNYNQVATNLTESCCGSGELHAISGLFQGLHTVFFTRVPAAETEVTAPHRYVIAPLTAAPAEELIADLHNRWNYGFTPIGMITMEETCLGLFRAEPHEDDVADS